MSYKGTGMVEGDQDIIGKLIERNDVEWAERQRERALIVAWLRKNAKLNPHLPDARALVLHFANANEDGIHRKGATT